ncbi:MAG: MotA/TolQ/ExbB proton channel family protein [Phycisphaerales bacterium]|nr:MotA/TolQ/ExbB proton channel family protein [Phycisphaerales bacterium]
MPGWMQVLVEIFRTGGWVMYPLLGLSLLAGALCFERAVFWLTTHSRGRVRRIAKITSRLRKGDAAAATALADSDPTVYGRLAASLLGSGAMSREALEALAAEQIETMRPALERFAVPLSTIITAAPMLGILGTVTGIIRSFRLLGGADIVTDPALVAGGIGEALYTTAFGLVVALATLFPFVVFRSQADRALGRLEALAAVIVACRAASEAGDARGQARDSAALSSSQMS